MKVITTLTTIDPLKGGGVCEMVYNLNSNIKDYYNDVEVEICSLDYDTPNEIKNKWSIFKTTLFKVLDPFYYGFSPSLKKHVLHSNADILHNHGVWEYTSQVCMLWKKKLKKPYIVTPHGMLDTWALGNNKGKKMFIYNLIERKYLSNASCIHALNQEEAASIRKLGLNNPVCIIPNGIDLPKDDQTFLPIWDEEKIKGKKVLLFLGRLHPKKGLENLLLAWNNLMNIEQSNEWILVIAGWAQNNYDEELRKIVSDNGLAETVLFLGPVLNDKKSSVLQNADAFILPSYSEGLPISILEAWAYSLPVLMTKECNLPEGFSKNCAIEIEPTVESIVESLKSFFSMSEKEKLEIGNNGFNLVKEKYSWEKVSSQMYSVYQWLLGKGEKPSNIYEQ